MSSLADRKKKNVKKAGGRAESGSNVGKSILVEERLVDGEKQKVKPADGCEGSGNGSILVKELLLDGEMRKVKPAEGRAIMIQGCGSDVGKSIIVAGLCRAAARRGYRVAPFKAQNMSNNAAATCSGGEIGRAQALQAKAAQITATVDMNPVLLKPQSDTTCQVIVQGKASHTMTAQDYFGSTSKRPPLLEPVLESFHRLRQKYDLVICEGAGSPAEINLRSRDICNMGFCVAAGGIPVVLVGDIDRGGVIAALVGTQTVLDPTDAAHIVGCIVNKFRGDLTLFHDGTEAIKRLTSWPCFGVIPWLSCVNNLPAEDSVSIELNNVHSATSHQKTNLDTGEKRIRIAAPMLSRMANFDDADPLRIMESDRVDFQWISPGKAIPINELDVIILFGTKSVLAELDFVRENGWNVDILAHVRQGGRVLGICGGYQMLGHSLDDPHGVDGAQGRRTGLKLLTIDTLFPSNDTSKTVHNVTGICATTQLPVSGYEIHMGITTGIDAFERPMFRDITSPDGVSERIASHKDGARSRCGKIEGCYLHGMFGNDAFRDEWLRRIGGTNRETPTDKRSSTYEATVESSLDDLADSLEAALDLDTLFAAARPANWKPDL